ncbi:MAG: sigma-70 family RNA polymerase sigma factor [Chloroflexota bacterium]|nr:sigma-70 family RNA polymerase sigma factor [Chloroflexota bacterium]
MHEDGQLIQQVRNGDLRAFETLYNKYKGQVYRTALAVTSDPGAAEDILQDCFLRVHANIDRLDGSVPISPWLHRVTVNLAYNLVAKRKRRAGSLEGIIETLKAGIVDSPDRFVEDAEVRDRVQAAIDTLSFNQRVVVTLFYLGEFNLEEIAYILDCPVGTVKSRLHYARNKLRVQLAGQADVLSGVML